ncbi:protein of unknown function [Filimonas lacunae]|uniref:DUF4920 domain-containing protein n=1 Tax=Filimonas lacunae TaxID=477680 RepID=A0A173MK56_9BACT|nr:DUF4920 domain-containing protein [Filimonas lacunae]BAV08023.1 hypothetical protein FLA_4056 [Filimonas lacunae]SIT08132.1 protein of unknown function [Filimonas lacunae]
MKFFFLFLLSGICNLAAVLAQPPQGNASVGSIYGDSITTEGVVAISNLPQKLQSGEKAQVKVRAKVLDVCPKKGCWMKLEVNDSTTAFVKMKDYGFFVPLAIKGKTVIIEGESFVKETSVQELKHYAEDAKKPKAEIDAITTPKKEIRLTASGIRVAG